MNHSDIEDQLSDYHVGEWPYAVWHPEEQRWMATKLPYIRIILWKARRKTEVRAVRRMIAT